MHRALSRTLPLPQRMKGNSSWPESTKKLRASKRKLGPRRACKRPATQWVARLPEDARGAHREGWAQIGPATAHLRQHPTRALPWRPIARSSWGSPLLPRWYLCRRRRLLFDSRRLICWWAPATRAEWHLRRGAANDLSGWDLRWRQPLHDGAGRELRGSPVRRLSITPRLSDSDPLQVRDVCIVLQVRPPPGLRYLLQKAKANERSI